MKATLLVSLLDRDDSDQLLRAMHRVLRPVDAAHVALVEPLEPRMGAAALQLEGREIAVITPAARPWFGESASQGGRHYVWCRDELEAEAAAHPAIPVVAATVEELAWELVRRLSGDLREAEEESSAAVSTDAKARDEPASPPIGDASVEVGPASETERSIRVPRALERRLPPTPKWAQGIGSEESAAQPPSVAEPAGDESRDRVDAVDKASSTETGEGVGGTAPLASPTPLTPLAAMAQSLRASGADTASREQSVVMHRAVHHRGRRLDRVRDLVGRGGLAFPRQADPDLAALGQALFRAHSTLVTVGTPKGGPGKTTEAAALGVLGARAVEPHGGSAVLVDANLNNPDAWRQLGMPSDAITVREIVDALNRSALVPNGEFARSERLRVLPERRGGGAAYGAHEIARLARHLRLRHTFVVVDLPNSRPSLAAGPTEALVAHWLRHADVAVIPIDLGEASFIAAGELLDALELMVVNGGEEQRMPGLVIPLLLPPDGRRALAFPVIADVLDHFRGAGAAVVEVPYSVEVQTASHRRTPLVGASRRTDRGFAGVLSAVVAAREAQVTGTGYAR